MPTATCDLRFSLQNRHADDDLVDALAELGISNGAVTLSGRATMSEKDISEEDFVGAKPGAIRATLREFLKEHEPLRAGDLVILDMEPEEFAPRLLGEFEGKRQRELIAAYERRIRVAGEVLRGTDPPGLRIGLYQVIVPDGRGVLSPGFARRLCGYMTAGRQGMYDELDFICPVLYQRFGPEDADTATLRERIAAMSRQGMDGSLALTRTNGEPIPLVPIVSFWVFNGRSENNRDAVRPVSVARQLEIVQASEGVEAILFWSGWQTTDEMENAEKPVEAIDIEAFLVRTGTLPWPGCT
jgi:hypothetical protein